MASAKLDFNRSVQFWRNKFSTRGPSFAGRQGEDVNVQTKRIQTHLRMRLKPDDFYEDGMDLGCGNGRFVSLLSQYCAHIWAVDVSEEILNPVRRAAPNVSAVKVEWPYSLPHPVDFMLASFFFQHITNDELLRVLCGEVKRVLKPGARVVILDNAVDKAWHVKPRDPAAMARLLDLEAGYEAERVTVNKRANDHWLIDGTRKRS